MSEKKLFLLPDLGEGLPDATIVVFQGMIFIAILLSDAFRDRITLDGLLLKGKRA